MKNKKSGIIAIVVLAALIAAALACWLIFKPKTEVGNKRIVIEVTHKDGTVREIEICTDEEYLREAMEQVDGLLEGEESSYGLYILAVDGETADETNQEWWGYTKSGERVNYGVDSCVIADGDHYEFTINVGYDEL